MARLRDYYSGTAFYVAPNILLTARHNVEIPGAFTRNVFFTTYHNPIGVHKTIMHNL